MGKSIAQAFRDEGKQEGEIKGLRDAFLRLLRNKFKKVPDSIVAEVEGTTDHQQLESWLDAILTARQITDIPFKSQP
jgi:hypothetical protein